MKKVFSIVVVFVFLSMNFCLAQKEGKSILVDGKSMHYLLTGEENRKLGQPLIILESNHASNVETWYKVIDLLGKNTPVLAYDRAGIGESEAFEELPTPENRTRQLKNLLAKLNLEPPYILVGHGWGGILIKDFAQSYPKQIEGMVYLDPADESSSFEKMVAIFDEEGWDGEKVAREYFDLRKERFQQAPEGIKAEAQVMYDFARGEKSKPALYDFPKIPSAILAGGKQAVFMENPFEPKLSVDYLQMVNLLHKNRIAEFTTQILNSEDSEMVLMSNYSHYLHLQEPEKIASSILSKYYGDPAKKLVEAAQMYDSEQFAKYLEGLEMHTASGKIPEATINMLGYDQLRKDQPTHALALFTYNLNRNPNSANVYDSMGDGLVALGKTQEAVAYYKKAVLLGEKSQHSDLGIFKKNLARVNGEN
ncbi:Pimeloyl-ACP methyl ester carboxylesterase [Algoriphagus faecimaris]|uniref:Pimeloyl-ACP methyl ester carboxylesterase n=1 Tax=Algoriphagus faecimaris TaxID=686796 RepID=A0A1G6V2L0_9BACT|nr:alpha/beta hydrolase [Algoriphagus faecimaris]SDD47723.1 Pimeloyl-ACP methyl ester carboxylesterase [Algoriphagus faecimaris]